MARKKASSFKEGDIRRAVVEDDLVEGMLALHGQLFNSLAPDALAA
jgi:type I restriction-modification system DNA methylase subunit